LNPRVETFIALAFLQFADFVSTWLFSLTGVEEGNKLVMAYRNGGPMLERVILIKIVCMLLLANMFLRNRKAMSWGNRSVRFLVGKLTLGRVQLEQRHFYHAFVVIMLAVITWNLLIAWSGALL
jgi:hypothetical protein